MHPGYRQLRQNVPPRGNFSCIIEFIGCDQQLDFDGIPGFSKEFTDGFDRLAAASNQFDLPVVLEPFRIDVPHFQG